MSVAFSFVSEMSTSAVEYTRKRESGLIFSTCYDRLESLNLHHEFGQSTLKVGVVHQQFERNIASYCKSIFDGI